MSSYIENIKQKMDWGNVFVRTGAFPLDRSSIFSSYSDAEKYAKGDGSDSRELGRTSYIGQIISIYENNEVKICKINAERQIEEIVINKEFEKYLRDSLTQIKESVGLDNDFFYTPNVDSTYISEALSFAEANEMLDNAVKELQDKTSVSEKEIYAAISETNLVTSNTIKEFNEKFDDLTNELIKDEKTVAAAITTIKDNVGLNESLQYIPNIESNYISTSTSLTEADTMLDIAIKEVDDKVKNIELENFNHLEINEEEQEKSPIQIVLKTNEEKHINEIHAELNIVEGGVLKQEGKYIYVDNNASSYIAEYNDKEDTVQNVLTDISNLISSINSNTNTLVTKISEIEKRINDIETNLQNLTIDASKIESKEINVIGTPLADLILSQRPEMTKINSSNVQDVLEILLTEELWPTNIGIIDATINGIVSVPTASNLASGIVNGSTVEVGTKCKLNDLTIYAPNIQTDDYIVTGLTYGYSLLDDNTIDSNVTTINYSANNSQVNSGVYEIIQSFTGFSNTNNVQVSGASYSTVTISSKDVIVSEGSNKVTVTYKTPSISATYNEIPIIYGCSNLGNTNANYKFDGQTEQVLTKDGISSSSTLSVTGIRYGFYGCVTDDFIINNANIRNLSNKLTSGASTSSFIINGTNVQKVIIALPSSWGKKISKVIANKQMGSDITGAYEKQNEQVAVNGANNYQSENYDIYIYNPSTVIDVNDVITLSNNN